MKYKICSANEPPASDRMPGVGANLTDETALFEESELNGCPARFERLEISHLTFSSPADNFQLVQTEQDVESCLKDGMLRGKIISENNVTDLEWAAHTDTDGIRSCTIEDVYLGDGNNDGFADVFVFTGPKRTLTTLIGYQSDQFVMCGYKPNRLLPECTNLQGREIGKDYRGIGCSAHF